MAVTCDVLIVGGGVMGVSIAHALARRRVGRVVLLEKAHLGAGASGKSGAVIRQHYSHRLTVLMAQQSLRVFEHFEDEVGGPPVFTRSGLAFIISQRDRAAVDANLAMQRELGIDARLVSPQELAAIDPHAWLAEDELAVFEAEAGYVEAVQAVTSFGDAARGLGADIRLGVEVKAILTDGDRVAGVETNEGRYECRTLVLATGPWAAQLAKSARLALPVQSCRTQAALLRRPPDLTARGVAFADFVQGISFKPADGDLLQAGSIAGEEAQHPVDPDAWDEAADGDWLRQIRQQVCRRYPAMQRGYGRGGFGALFGITPDWHPILDRWPGLEGAYWAVGFSGHGFKLAPVVGRLMAELIVDGETKTLDISSFRLRRFEENDRVQPPHRYGVMG